MDSGQHRGLNQARVSERHEIVVAVDEIELSGMLKDFGDVKIFGDFGIDVAVLFVSASDHGMQAAACNGIRGGKESDVPAPRDKAFRNIARDRFPRAVLSRRRSPCNRRKDRDSSIGKGHRASLGSMAARTSLSGTVAKPVA